MNRSLLLTAAIIAAGSTFASRAASVSMAAVTGPPGHSTVVICGPWSGTGRVERDHATKPGPGAYERSHGLYWYWAIKPQQCQLVRRGGSPDVHVNWVLPSKMHWTVWSSMQAVGHGINVDMGTFPITVTLTRPRMACGHRVFTQASFNGGGVMRLRDWCL